jgi:excisionase family DNA binding protein
MNSVLGYVEKRNNHDILVNSRSHNYLTKAQVCDLLGLGIRAVEGWMRRGHLPYFKIGRWVRFLEDDIHRHLQKYRIDRNNRFQPSRRSKKLAKAASNLFEPSPIDQPDE